MFLIGGIQKTTLVDFPQKVAAIVFTQGCNFRCGYCHNPSLISKNKNLPDYISEDFFSFLKTRIGKLDGVVITGGEPTLQKGLYDFIKRIKQMGFEVKLDTNGTNPQILEKLINDNLLDYIAMDIKAPLEKYPMIVNTAFCNAEKKSNSAPFLFETENVAAEFQSHKSCREEIVCNVLKSIELIKNCKIDYEFRTTVVKSQLSFEDFEKIGKMIKGAKRYYLQKFVPSNILDKKLLNEQTYCDEEFKKLCQNLKKYVEFVDYR